MNRTQVNRTVTAQRAMVNAARCPRASTSTRPATNLLARVQTEVHAGAVIRRTKAVRLTSTQRDSTGKRSDWNASPYFFTAPAWSDTVSTMPRGER